MNYQVSKDGFYGEFGGAFIPEVLQKNIDNLQRAFDTYSKTDEFLTQYDLLLKDYVGRPSPLYYSEKLSTHYGAKIYLKREDLNHTGAHKINNTLGQILLAKHMGKTRIIAETGAGSHGLAVATVCAMMEMECVIYMGVIDIARQAPNVQKMEFLGAKVVPATSGGQGLADAVNEALIDWCENPEDTFYLIGSAVGPHPYPTMVTHFQSVISKEIKAQLFAKESREYPDMVIACVGGGSNASGAFYHFLEDDRVALVAAEATGLGLDSGKTAATLSLGKPAVLHGSRNMMLMDEAGEMLEPYSISAGLDYPGVGPLLAHLSTSGRMRVVGITDTQALDAAFRLTKMEGIIPALESSHALAALEQLSSEFKPEQIVVVNLSGRGDKDIETYLNIFNN